MKKRALALLVVLLISPVRGFAKEKFDQNDPYNFTLLDEYKIKPINTDEFSSVDEIIEKLLNDYAIDTNKTAIAYYNFLTEETYYLNPRQQMLGASVYKLPLAAMYLDYINQGLYTYDTPIPYNDVYFVEGAGDVTNNPKQSTYPLAYLLQEAITHSDNTASWMLVSYHYGSWGNFIQAQQDFVQNWDIDSYHYDDSYMSAYQILLTLTKIANDPSYSQLIDWLLASEPQQLFTSFVPQGMANKYGRMDGAVNDAGIYYEDGQPIYALVVFTQDVDLADLFLEEINLRVNEWARSQL